MERYIKYQNSQNRLDFFSNFLSQLIFEIFLRAKSTNLKLNIGYKSTKIVS